MSSEHEQQQIKSLSDSEAANAQDASNSANIQLADALSSTTLTPNVAYSAVATATSAIIAKRSHKIATNRLKPDGSNYALWLIEIIPILGEAECLDTTKNSISAADFEVLNTPSPKAFEVISIINANVDTSLQLRIQQAAGFDPKAAMNFLKKEFSGKNKSRKSALVQQLVTPIITLDNLVSDMEDLCRIAGELTIAHGSTEMTIDSLAVDMLIMSLPIDLSHVATEVERKRDEGKIKNLPDAMVAIREGSETFIRNNNLKKRKRPSEIADQTSNRPIALATKPSPKDWSQVTCRDCGQLGHGTYTFAACPKHDPAKANKRGKRGKRDQVGYSVRPRTASSNLPASSRDIDLNALTAGERSRSSPPGSRERRYSYDYDYYDRGYDRSYDRNYETEYYPPTSGYRRSYTRPNPQNPEPWDMRDNRRESMTTINSHRNYRSISPPDHHWPFEKQGNETKVAYALTKASQYEASGVTLTIDSGAHPSYVNNKLLLNNFINKLGFVNTAQQNAEVATTGEGTLTLAGELTLPRVIYSPTMSMNLISVSDICDLGLEVRFTNSRCFITKHGRNILTASRCGGLYQLEQPHPTYALRMTESDRHQLWHRRYGHLYERGIQQVFSLVDGMDHCKPSTERCPDCILTKITRRSFRPSLSRASRPGELIHSDIVELEERSIHGDYKYFATFLDDYSRYLEVSLLVRKSDLSEEFKAYDARINNLFGRHITSLRSDGGSNPKGTEYHSKAMKTYCKEHGIHQQSSTNTTPEENARAERLNRTIVESCNAMLQTARLPKCMWAFAVLCKVYLMNRSPHKAVKGATPFERFTGKRPNVSNLRVFGTAAIVHRPKTHRKHLDLRGVEAIFVGYATTMKAWLFWDHKEGKLLSGSTATFGNEFFSTEERYKLQIEAHNWGACEDTDSEEDNYLESVRQPFNPKRIRANTEENKQVTFLRQNKITAVEPARTKSVRKISTTVGDHAVPRQDLGDPGHGTDIEQSESEELTISDSSDTEDSILSNPSADRVTDLDLNSLPIKRTRRPNQIRQANLNIVALATNEADDIDFEMWTNAVLALAATEPDSTMNPTFKQAMAGPYQKEFIVAIKKEYASLEENKVFQEYATIPHGIRPLGTKLVLKVKETENATDPVNCKGRLCAQGFNQIETVNYHETYAPVACYDSLRMFLAILITLDYEIDTVDVITAFLLSDLQEEIYIKVPDGYIRKDPNTKYLRLLKTLYGLKQSPHMWNKDIASYLISLGFRQFNTDRCIFIGQYNGSVTYILLYVDDIIIGTKNRSIMSDIKEAIHSKYPIKDKGPIQFFLNIHFTRNRKERTLSFHQWSKIERVIAEFLPEGRPSKIPADISVHLTKDMCPTEPDDIKAMKAYPYRRLVGILLHIALTARPDIITAVSAAGRYSHNPGMPHWTALLKVVSYLKDTCKYVMTFSGTFPGGSLQHSIYAYADSDWAGDKSRKSRTGSAIYLNNCLVLYGSNLQGNYALSTMEAETNAGCSTAQSIMRCRNFMEEAGYKQDISTILFEDNASCITTNTSWKAHPGSRHYELKQFYLRHKVMETKEIFMHKISTTIMTADLFTKQLPHISFARHRAAMGLHPIQNEKGSTSTHEPRSIHPKIPEVNQRTNTCSWN